VANPPTILERCLCERLARVQAQLAARQVEGLLISDSALLYWLGTTNSPLLLVTNEGGTELSPTQTSAHLGKLGQARVGFDVSLTASQLVFLQEMAPAVRWIPLGEELASVRSVKDAVELALLRQAACITRLAFEGVEREIAEDRSELDLLHCATATLLAEGGQGFSFDPSIASGPRSCQLWAGTTLRKLQLGEPVLIDLGIAFRGYHCDMARTYIVGGRQAALSTDWVTALDAVEDALAQMRAEVRPGARCGELHAMAERLLARYGGLPHALGHGIGLGVHERPRLSPGSPDILVPGMVIALEPGIIFGAEAGIRREDVIIVTDDGCEGLTS